MVVGAAFENFETNGEIEYLVYRPTVHPPGGIYCGSAVLLRTYFIYSDQEKIRISLDEGFMQS